MLVACGGGEGDGPPNVDAGAGAGGGGGAPPSKVAFVSSTEYTPDFGTAEAADALCTERASFVGLPGSFRAWLSDASSSPSSRFSRPLGNYVRVKGAVIAKGWVGLTTEVLKVPLDYDEFGDETLLGFTAWTGTDADGTATSQDCSTWSGKGQGTFGDIRAYDQSWTKMPSPAGCGGFGHLYCFEQ
jgi:hypothetical protein